MALVSAVGSISLVLATGGLLLRRRISRNWITQASISAPQFTKDQTIIITGGNTGLGYEAAKYLANCGGKIILACRNGDAGKRAALELRETTGNKDVEFLKLDLGDLSSVRSFATNFKKRNEKIHALICNAGVWMPDDAHGQNTKTKDGFEIHFGVNHLGNFALIQSLIPQMEQSGIDSRIVIVSSSLCKSGKIDLQKRDFIYDGRVPEPNERKSFAPTGYCDSKLLNMLTCRELAVKLGESNITTYAVSPGLCSSRLGRNVKMPAYKKMLAAPVMRLFQRSSRQGALNLVFAVTEDNAKLESGGMYQDGVIWKDGVDLIDALGGDLQKRVWELSEELVSR